jgi:hypothetical protein
MANQISASDALLKVLRDINANPDKPVVMFEVGIYLCSRAALHARRGVERAQLASVGKGDCANGRQPFAAVETTVSYVVGL